MGEEGKGMALICWFGRPAAGLSGWPSWCGYGGENELLVGCSGRRLEGGSMDLVTGEIEQRRNSTPLDRTREAEGGGYGGW